MRQLTQVDPYHFLVFFPHFAYQAVFISTPEFSHFCSSDFLPLSRREGGSEQLCIVLTCLPGLTHNKLDFFNGFVMYVYLRLHTNISPIF